jgi:8-oxo-dGTP diphosphatase
MSDGTSTSSSQAQTARFGVAVGALIWRPSDGRYLLLRRSADKDFAAGWWECVTGRVDHGESITQALHREVAEELGVQVQTDFLIGTFRFYRGPEDPEYEMIGLHFCCSCNEADDVTLSWEHSEYRWAAAAEADRILPPDHWLHPVIARAETLRALMPSDLLHYNRNTGFEL